MSDNFPQSHLDPTDEITLEAVKKRAVSGVVVLTGRTFLLSIITLVATGLLTVFLSPEEFGVFWAVSAVVNFLAYFSDIGLAAALIQRKKKLHRKDLVTTFTVQQGLVFTLIFLLLILTPVIKRYYDLTTQDMYLLIALGISLMMSSFKTIPSVLLERNLEFGKLVIPQVLENLVFSITAVLLAWKGFGVTSFTYAVLARGVVGLGAMYIIKPWMPAIGISRKSLKRLMKYGVPYQANTLLATIKDDGMTIFLGGILGTAGLGLLGWAQKWAQAPLRFFMDQVIKVTFPAFSRMQDDIKQLERSVTRSILFICFLVYPMLAGLIVIAPLLVDIIPRYDKWAPALTALTLIGITTVFAAVTTQVTNLLNAIGKIKLTFKFMVMWTVLTWIFVPALAIRYGINGAALGYVIVSSSSLIVIYIARRYVKFSVAQAIQGPLISSIVMAFSLLFIRQYVPINLLGVGVMVAGGCMVYLGLMYLLAGASFVNDAKRAFRILFKR